MRHSKCVMYKIAAIPPGTGPMSYRRLHHVRPANTLFSGHRAPPAHFAEARSITVREVARLQCFPGTSRACGSFADQMEQAPRIVRRPTMAPLISGRVCRYRLKLNGTPARADIIGYQSESFIWLINAE